MINLFETFNDASQKLQQSLYLADYRHPTIVMDDNGFLPDDVISPYKFFANYKQFKDDTSTFFNEVNIPPLWEIAGNQNIEDITDSMAKKIIQYFNKGLTRPHDMSYKIAKPYETTNITQKWQNLINEVLQ